MIEVTNNLYTPVVLGMHQHMHAHLQDSTNCYMARDSCFCRKIRDEVSLFYHQTFKKVKRINNNIQQHHHTEDFKKKKKNMSQIHDTTGLVNNLV